MITRVTANSQSFFAMAKTDLKTYSSMAFDDLPGELRARVYGVDYASVETHIGGMLYVTRYGWNLLDNILPSRWFCQREYARDGEKLKGGTGAVFHLDTCSLRTGKTEGLVIKFSRFGQDVPIFVEESYGDHLPREVVDTARFNDPFEEFGMVMALRRNTQGPETLRVRTKRPLAIYEPSREYEPWQLGRTPSRVAHYQRNLSRDQAASPFAPIELNIHHDYVMLYEWVDGFSAEDAYDMGQLTEAELHSMTFRVQRELEIKGFRVLDNKPKHFILRHRRGTRDLMRRHGELVYTLVDFELLQRI
jgi:hypothetical protein